MQRVRIKKMRDNAVAPAYKHHGDSGFDLTACETVEIPPLQTRAVSLGWAFEIPEGLEIQIRPRSGVSRDTPALVITGTVDSSYRGEVSAIVHNRSNSDMTIQEGRSICQGILAPVIRACFKETDDLSETVRGAAGFGSTGV
jgi:dUTP pyrophosphatase